MTRFAAVVITGAPGTGKSATLEALSDLLADEGLPHGALELEQLGWGYPWLRFTETLPQLRAVLAAQRTLGRDLFLIAATAETDRELDALVKAIGGPVLVVAVRSRQETAAGRILRREPEHWSGRSELAERGRLLATTIPRLRGVDLVVDTDELAPVQVARLIHAAIGA